MSTPFSPPSLTSAERLQGTVEKVVFHNPSTGYYVLKIQVDNPPRQVDVTGLAASVVPGQRIDAEGRWIRHPQHGSQFQARLLHVFPPQTHTGLAQSLGAIQGIGPALAHRLVDAFGASVDEVIERHPERLLDLDGIGPTLQQRIVDACSQQQAIQAITDFLHAHGLDPAYTARLYRGYDNDSFILGPQGVGFHAQRS